MNPNYRQIGESLFSDLARTLESGRHVALIGGRDIGKRFVIHRLSSYLRGDGQEAPYVVTLELDLPPPVDFVLVQERANEAARKTQGDLEVEADSENLLGSWEKLSRNATRPLICLVANLDRLPQTLALRLLEELDRGASRGNFAVLLSGEAHLPQILSYQHSLSDDLTSFVLQGFDEQTFRELVKSRRDLEEKDVKELHAQTGGQLHLLRQVLWAVDEAQFRHDAVGKPLDLSEFWRNDQLLEHLHLYGLDLFRDAIRQLDADQSNENIEGLIQFLEGEENGLYAKGGLPTVLELIGLLKRDPETRRLTWASLLASRFAACYFTPRRRGHLCAIRRDWDRAQRQFEKIRSDERTTFSCDGEDLAERTQVVDAYCAEFHRLSAPVSGSKSDESSLEKYGAALETMIGLLNDVLRYVLGFEEVIFATRAYTSKWEVAPRTAATSRMASGDVLPILNPKMPLGIFAPTENHWMGLVMRGPRAIQERQHTPNSEALQREAEDEERSAVLAQLPGRYAPLEQQGLARRVLEQFAMAHYHLAEQRAQKEQLAARAEFAEIVGEIFDQLHREPTDAVGIVQQTAKMLMDRFSYKRVLFSLVDTRQRFIQGKALKFVPGITPPVDLALATNYWLDDFEKDVQPRCVREKKPFRIRDAATDRGKREGCQINEKLVADAKARGFVVLPIMSSRGHDCLGTLHVERLDNTLPTLAEQDDLLSFTARIGAVLEQSERMNLLMCALDEIGLPVAIVDARERLHFANAQGAELVGRGPGPYHFAEPLEPIKAPCRTFEDELRSKVLEDGQRDVTFFLPGDLKSKRIPQRLHAVPFSWSQHRGGALLRSESLEWQFYFLEAAEILMRVRRDRTEFLQQLAPVMGKLGIRAGRIYRKDPWSEVATTPQALKPLASFDLDDPDRVPKFLALSDDLSFKHDDDPKGPARTESWRCFYDKDNKLTHPREAIVFGYFPEEPMEAGDRYFTPLGLACQNVRDPLFNRENKDDFLSNAGRHNLDAFRKRKNAIWVDLPLYWDNKIFGKMTFDCSDQFGPEQFALLNGAARVLGEMAGDLQEIFFLRKTLSEGFGKIMAKVGKAMRERISEIMTPLAVLMGTFRRQTEAYPDFESFAADLAKSHSELEERLRAVRKDSDLIIEGITQEMKKVGP